VRTGDANRYDRIIETIFLARYRKGDIQISFCREDIERTATDLDIKLPKNLGDLIYSFRFRAALPDNVAARAPKGKSWIIRLVGRGQYRFVATALNAISPNASLATTRIPDATPGMIVKYALSDEQALLAKLRYNRLVDVFTGLTCYSLQSHLRTTAPEIGQIETDEVYIGVDRRGAHYVLPVQAKGGRDRQNVVQIEQDMAMCSAKFPGALCRPLAAQFMADGTIAMFEFEGQEEQIVIAAEKHYQLVPPEQLSDEELLTYRRRSTE
jgi:hypothetical protein